MGGYLIMKKSCCKENIKGFTLIELLVVVLIIGILAAIALPQYQKAVEKSRLTEVLHNAKVVEDCFDWYILEHGLPSSGYVNWWDIDCPVEIDLGGWNEDSRSYKTKNFEYQNFFCNKDMCSMEVHENIPEYRYSLSVYTEPSLRLRNCYTESTDKGREVCGNLRDLGWVYIDSEL